LREAVWPMPPDAAVVAMFNRPVAAVEGLEARKAAMVTLPAAHSIPFPPPAHPQVVASLAGRILSRGKPAKSQWAHKSHVVISLNAWPS
jgi:hypothetical protein